ncbi:stalk domain-containing protein, partial [Ammoniphilus sp. YIM 78166]|uniref:stalk domain-containing protein n=1 Tax=Ammoniphilus sp. YIM 78166 TaxID=1644106 RepID=UPI00196AC1C2
LLSIYQGLDHRHFMKLLIMILFLALAYLPTQANTDTHTHSNTNASQHLVALGDSLTVGYEPGGAPYYGIIDRLYEQALYRGRAEFHNFGINGLTSGGLRELLQSVSIGGEAPRNIRQVGVGATPTPEAFQQALKTANIITITIGGNDFIRLPLEIQGKTDKLAGEVIDARIQEYEENLESVLQMLYDINPGAAIYVADQYQPYPPVDVQLYRKLGEATERFTQTLDQLVKTRQEKGHNVYPVYVAQPFVGKEISLTHITRLDIHPNQAGYGKMAEAFGMAIWGELYPAPLKAENKPLSILVKGKEVDSPHKPILIEGRTFIPLREYTEALGAEVEWDPQTKSAIVKYQSRVVGFQIGWDQAKVGNVTVPLTGAVRNHHGKTYVPLRAMAEGLGFDVQYVERSKIVFINP